MNPTIRRTSDGYWALDPTRKRAKLFRASGRGMRRARVDALRWQRSRLPRRDDDAIVTEEQRLDLPLPPVEIPVATPPPDTSHRPLITLNSQRVASKAQNLELSVRQARKLGAEVQIARGTGEYLFFHEEIGTCRVNSRRKDSPRALSVWLRKLYRTNGANATAP